MLNSKRNERAARWMAAACAAAGMVLAGCDAASDPSHAARKAGAEAARHVAAAGDMKATDKLYDMVAAGASSISPGANGIGEYVTTAAPEKDLQAAVDKLNGAINSDLASGVKSALESELGSAQLELSLARFVSLQKDIQELTRQALALQDVAQGASDLGKQAETLEAGAAQAAQDVQKLKTASEKGAAEVTTRQAALAQAQQKIKAIQDQIAAKQSEARKIYADTDTAFQASVEQKGAAGIAAGKKAMDDRSAADKLTQEIGNLAPDLLQAEGELSLAQLALTDAQNLAKASAGAYDASVQAAEKTTQRAKDLRTAAAKIVNDPDGVKQRLAAFTEAYAKLDAKLKSAANAADQASSAFNTASNDYRDARSKAKDIADEKQVEPSDPLAKLAKDDRPVALLLWSVSAASQQSGRVNLAGADMAEMAGVAVKIAGQALAAAREKDDTKLPDNKYRDDAMVRFTKAVESAANGTKLPSPIGQDLDRIKWIGYGLEASAQLGLYRSTNKPDALAAAKTAQNNAVNGNPSLKPQLSWLDDVK